MVDTPRALLAVRPESRLRSAWRDATYYQVYRGYVKTDTNIHLNDNLVG